MERNNPNPAGEETSTGFSPAGQPKIIVSGVAHTGQPDAALTEAAGEADAAVSPDGQPKIIVGGQ